MREIQQKAGIVSGLSKEDRNTYGVFPLKGKLMNTLNENQNRINQNAEIANIKKIVGLISNKVYDSDTAKKTLRYGRILFMTDQDLDGSHIKGLCINMFHSQWHDLVKIPNFLGFMNTPILKATKGKNVKSFYNESEYELWKQENNGGKGWKIKYYKGLGTSTAKEFKEYFAQKRLFGLIIMKQKAIMQLIKYLIKHVQTIEKIGWEIMITRHTLSRR